MQDVSSLTTADITSDNTSVVINGETTNTTQLTSNTGNNNAVINSQTTNAAQLASDSNTTNAVINSQTSNMEQLASNTDNSDRIINSQTSNTEQLTGNSDNTETLAANKQKLGFATYNPIDDLTLPQNEGLFVTNDAPNHPYLVETNPEFTQYLNFISSDYFLDKLGLDPEKTATRLGDGFYETRLIRDAVFASTGRRYLDGQHNDLDQFKYLMDNAIAEQNDLDLAVGIALNKEQVARLTHDIVWMVEQEVQGQTALAPVYYAAAVKPGDVQRSGSLLSATTLSLSAGTVRNTGAMEAEQSLSLHSDTDIINRGSLSSADDLSMIAQNSISNIGGHISSSGSMLLVARTGDIELGRDVNTVTYQQGGRHQITQIGTASDVQAGDALSLVAGDDIKLVGSSLNAGSTITATAEGDITIAAVEDRRSHTVTGRKRYRQETETRSQIASSIVAGDSVTLDSGQDLTLVASHISSGDTIALSAEDDISIESAANSQHSDTQRKRRRNINTLVQQQTSSLSAEQDITVEAGNDMLITASELEAKNDIQLNAAGSTTLEAAENSRYSFYYKKKKKSFGRSKTKTRENERVRSVASSLIAGGDVRVNARKNEEGTTVLNQQADTVTMVGSDIQAGNDITVVASDTISVSPGTDYDYSYYKKSKKGLFGIGSSKTRTTKQQRQQRARLTSGDDISLDAGNNIALIAPTLTATDDLSLNADNQVYLGSAKDSDYEHVEYSKTGAFKWEFGNEGHQDETVRHTELTAGGTLSIHAGNGVIVEYKQDGTLTESIDSLSQLPELAWMDELRSRDDIDWQAIEEVHKQWQEHEEGVGGPGFTLVAIAVAIATSGAGTELLGLSETAALGTLSAVEAAQIAVVDSLINQAAMSLITNGGDIGAVFKDLISKDGLLTLATAGMTAGITNGLFKSLNIPQGVSLSQLDTTQLVQASLINAGVKSTLDAALYGDSFGDALKNNLQTAAVSAVGAKLASGIGDVTSAGSIGNIISHGVLGCALGEAQSGDCGSGAVGGAFSAAIAPHIAASVDDGDGVLSAQEKIQISTFSRLGTVLFSALIGKDFNVADNTARNELTHNYLGHVDATARAEALYQLAACESNAQVCSAQEIQQLNDTVSTLDSLDTQRDVFLEQCTGATSVSAACTQANEHLQATVNEYVQWRNTDEGKTLLSNIPIREEYDSSLLYGETFSNYLADPKGFIDSQNTKVGAIKNTLLTAAAVGGILVTAEVISLCMANPVACTELAYELKAEVEIGGAIGSAGVAIVKVTDEMLQLAAKSKTIAGVEDLAGAGRKVDGVGIEGSVNTPTQRWKYENRLDVKQRTAEDVNADHAANGNLPPYKSGTQVVEYTTKETDQFVRVHGEGNQARSWMMRKEAIEGLTAEQIQRKYSLPFKPTLISDIEVPAGTRIRTGKVEANFEIQGGGGQGATQHELLNRLDEKHFTNKRPLGN